MNYHNELIKANIRISNILCRKSLTENKRNELTYMSKLCNSLLDSINTAGGKHIIKRELDNLFYKLNQYKQ